MGHEDCRHCAAGGGHSRHLTQLRQHQLIRCYDGQAARAEGAELGDEDGPRLPRAQADQELRGGAGSRHQDAQACSRRAGARHSELEDEVVSIDKRLTQHKRQMMDAFDRIDFNMFKRMRLL